MSYDIILETANEERQQGARVPHAAHHGLLGSQLKDCLLVGLSDAALGRAAHIVVRVVAEARAAPLLLPHNVILCAFPRALDLSRRDGCACTHGSGLRSEQKR